MSRFECHAHTMYSNVRLLDAIVFPEKLIDRAIELGLKGIAVTDHELLASHVVIDKYAQKIKKEYPDFKVAKGNEIYLCDSRDTKQKYYHFILIAKDAVGHKMLRELSSIAWVNSYYDRGMERVPTLKSELAEIISKYGKGHLIASTACLGSELDYLILEKDKAKKVGNIDGEKKCFNEIINFVNWCKQLFEDDFYLEVQPAKSEEQMIVNRIMGSVGKFFNVKIIVTTDAHYLRKEDREIHKAYLNSKGGEREVDAFYEYAYLQSTEEVIENLEGTGLDYYELEANTHEIYDKIEDYTLARKQQVPEVEVPVYPVEVEGHHYYDVEKYPTLDYLMHSEKPQERYWVNYCQNELNRRGLKDNEVYLARLEEEADIQKHIGDKLGTCMFSYPIFLQHYINMFWEVGSTVGAGRGSACAGLNHYLLGITQLDPIQHELPYWRFLNHDRVELPDIDIDICPSKREEIFSRIREERGDFGCIQVCTYGTETTRSAIATACRGYRSEEWPDGIDTDAALYMARLIPMERGFIWPIRDVVYGNPEKDRKPVKNFINEVNKYPGLLEIIENIEGLVNHRGIHASGVNFYDNTNPYETACFMKATSGAITTQFSLHDAEYCGDVKYDFLVTEIQDVIVQCVKMLQEHNEMDSNLSLKEVYNKYLHPDVLPIEDSLMWDTLAKGEVLKLFQFDSQVGGQTVKTLKPRTPKEMATCNSVMRLMAQEKGAETPTERYARMKKDINEWYREMKTWDLTQAEQKVLEEYCLSSYGTPAQQEDMMKILMDKRICGFTLAEANDARKICAKKQMNRIPELHDKILDKATSKTLGEYVWKVIVNIQLGYSFSEIHSLAYSFVGLQTIYLATYFNPVYWNTACLRVDSGLDEDASSNYGKIAKAVGNIINRGIDLSLIDINKSGYMFEPDVENDTILYGMKGLNGVGGEIIQEIIANRPYYSLTDFMEKVKCNKTVMVSLIKSGAFDKFGNRGKIMDEYIWAVCEPKKRITMQNFNGLNERNLLPDELDLQKRTFNFNKMLKKYCSNGDKFILKDRYYDFYERHFDVDLLETCGSDVCIDSKVWKKLYDKTMLVAKDYLTKNKDSLLAALNNSIFQEMWDKYAEGNYSSWEMESLGFYYHEHELAHVRKSMYNIVEFDSLSEEPEVSYVFKRNGVEIPIFKTQRIIGTVIAKDDNKSTVSILTVDSGVVNVKFSRDYYARYNRRLSEPQPDGTKKVRENGWFQKGTLIVVNGIRRGDMFIAKKYKNTPSHQLYKITEINENGTISMTNKRWGEESEDELV